MSDLRRRSGQCCLLRRRTYETGTPPTRALRLPANPKGWLITVASRRRTELWRNDSARRRREETAVALAPPDPEPVPAVDDTLTLLLLCCYPSLTQVSQVALTLRAVGGFSTAKIARAFLVPEATVGQRISPGEQRIKTSGAEFRMHPRAERSERMVAVRHVLYLIFNEGYTASSGSALHRVELTTEAIRLTRQLRDRLPSDGEVAGHHRVDAVRAHLLDIAGDQDAARAHYARIHRGYRKRCIDREIEHVSTVPVRRTFFESTAIKENGIVGEPEIVCIHHCSLRRGQVCREQSLDSAVRIHRIDQMSRKAARVRARPTMDRAPAGSMIEMTAREIPESISAWRQGGVRPW